MFSSEDIPIGLSNLLQNTQAVKAVIKFKETNDFNIQIAKGEVFKEWAFHFVDSNFMEYINRTTLAGNCQLTNPSDILLTKAIALKYFGTINCIGKEIKVLGDQNSIFNFVVSGVFEYQAPRSIRPEYNLVARIDIFNKLREDFKYGEEKTKTKAFLILKKNKEADRNNIMQSIHTYYVNNVDKDYFKNKSIQLVTLKKHYFEQIGKRLNAFILICLVILLVALINFIIHNNSQFRERCKTMGINKIVGSKPEHAILHSFTESIIINFLSLLVSFSLAISILPFVSKYLNDALDINFLPLPSIFTAGLVIAIVISLFTSLASIFLSRHKPIILVSKQLNRGEKGKLLNSIMIILQVSVTSFLMIMLFSTTRQLKYVQNLEWGFDAEEVMYISLNDDLPSERFNDLKDHIKQIQGVKLISGCWHVPPARDKFFIGYIDENGKQIMIDKNEVDYQFLKILGIKLKSGRDFNKNIDQPWGSIIVNQEYLDLKKIQNPYDTLVKLDDESSAKQIIGVIDEYHMRGMNETITPQIYELNPNQSRKLIVKLSPNHIMSTLDEIKHEFSKVFPDKTYEIGFIKDDIQHLYKSQKDFNSLISYYTLISLILSCMGLYAFTMNEMNKRIKEVGIRKVNGAKTIELFNFLNREFLVLGLIGLMISSPIGFYFSQKWAENFAYKLNIAWWIFLLVAILVLFVVSITVSIQTFSVARRNPVESLRYE
jgi:putative ABC transport system permease protein